MILSLVIFVVNNHSFCILVDLLISLKIQILSFFFCGGVVITLVLNFAFLAEVLVGLVNSLE